jgi:hypothetical protein
MTAVRLAALTAIAALVIGCSPTPAVAPTGTPVPTIPLKATATPLAVEQQPTAKAVSGSYYKPPGWDGVSDVNCKDFDTHAHAMSFFRGTGGSPSNDPYGLDGDHDGNACETLP